MDAPAALTDDLDPLRGAVAVALLPCSRRRGGGVDCSPVAGVLFRVAAGRFVRSACPDLEFGVEAPCGEYQRG